ncbi:radical SAM protein [Clostridium sp.]|uniref:radical SAM/SPASM domain-containing protein n=1 Tax=Clostridium sp. TaxID=1506 RepID=UPI002A82DB05|nr:radical SAM protein [Clostridium sp.]MDY4251245.1 radical SAM protein [Clostridium sp.]
MITYKHNNKYIIYDREDNEISISDTYPQISKEQPRTLLESKQIPPKNKCSSIRITYVSSPNCNMACKYCYEKDNLTTFNLSNITSEEHMNIYLKNKKRFPNSDISICFFGGEPFLASKEILKFLNELELYCKNNNHKFPNISAITNGTVYNEQIQEMLTKYFNSLTISMDGTKCIHNTNRVYKNGKGTFDDIVKNINNINKYRKYPLAIEITVTDAYFDNYNENTVPDIFELFKELKADQVEFIYEHSVEPYDNFKINNIDRLAKDIVNQWFTELIEFKKTLYIASIENFLSLILGDKKVENFTCAAGEKDFAYDSFGNVYACQTLVGKNEHILGSYKDRHLNIDKNNSKFLSMNTCKHCFNCECRYACGGFCKVVMTESGETLPLACIFRRSLFKYIILYLSDSFDSGKFECLKSSLISYFGTK